MCSHLTLCFDCVSFTLAATASPEVLAVISSLKLESVVSVAGTVQRRAASLVNARMPTGEVEVIVDQLQLLNNVEGSLPLPVHGPTSSGGGSSASAQGPAKVGKGDKAGSGTGSASSSAATPSITAASAASPSSAAAAAAGSGVVSEDMRLRHRDVDLRGVLMQRNLRLRSAVTQAIRSFLHWGGSAAASAAGGAGSAGSPLAAGAGIAAAAPAAAAAAAAPGPHVPFPPFVEVETPTLFRSTPEGAREYLVPTRSRGKFYALTQSPQQWKQVLMVGGMDRYFQIARCYRDEGGRVDRQPEFTQVDLEMAFARSTDVQAVTEGILAAAFGALRAAAEGAAAHELPPWLAHIPPLSAWLKGAVHGAAPLAALTLPPLPLERLTFAHVLARYGSDKPDRRLGMRLSNVTSAMDCAARAAAAAAAASAEAAPGGSAGAEAGAAAALASPKVLPYVQLAPVAATVAAGGAADAASLQLDYTPGPRDAALDHLLPCAGRSVRAFVVPTGAASPLSASSGSSGASATGSDGKKGSGKGKAAGSAAAAASAPALSRKQFDALAACIAEAAAQMRFIGAQSASGDSAAAAGATAAASAAPGSPAAEPGAAAAGVAVVRVAGEHGAWTGHPLAKALLPEHQARLSALLGARDGDTIVLGTGPEPLPLCKALGAARVAAAGFMKAAGVPLLGRVAGEGSSHGASAAGAAAARAAAPAGGLDGATQAGAASAASPTTAADVDGFWVTDFPLFDANEEEVAAAGSAAERPFVSTHHPFTAPDPEDAAALREILADVAAAAAAAAPAAPAADSSATAQVFAQALQRHRDRLLRIRGQHYDIVLNGWEVGGGSIRVHDRGTQEDIMRRLLLLPESQMHGFRHLLDALGHGAPPHGGLALGLDRLICILAGADAAPSLRDVIAFPKSTRGNDLFTEAPAEPTPEQLCEYHIALQPLK